MIHLCIFYASGLMINLYKINMPIIITIIILIHFIKVNGVNDLNKPAPVIPLGIIAPAGPAVNFPISPANCAPLYKFFPNYSLVAVFYATTNATVPTTAPIPTTTATVFPIPFSILEVNPDVEVEVFSYYATAVVVFYVDADLVSVVPAVYTEPIVFDAPRF